MGKWKLTIEEMEERHPDIVKGQKWRGVFNKYTYKCDVHGEYKQSFDSHNSGHGCQKCALIRKARLTIKEIEQRHPNMTKGQIWRGNKAKYEYLCKKHGIYKQSFDNHEQGLYGCPQCAVIGRGASHRLTIGEAEQRHPDLVKRQRWRGVDAKYKYLCEKHGTYLITFDSRNGGSGCPKCWHIVLDNGKAISGTPEYRTVSSHFSFVFTSKNPNHKNYKGMPFYDGWNSRKGGSISAGAEWIIKNLGERQEGTSLHIVEHEKGFVPGNLEWAYPTKQSAKRMFKVIADLKHRIKELETENAHLKSNA
jgi:hypothetical protein